MLKFKKKSLLSLFLILCLMLSLCGCKKDKDGKSENTKEDTVATDTEETTDTPLTDTIVTDPSTPEALEEQKDFDQWLWEEFEETVTSDSLTLHYNLAHPENYGIDPIEPTYGDIDMSEDGIAESKEEAEETFDELQNFQYDLLTSEQKFTYDILYNDLNTNLDSYNYVYLQEPFAYTSGVQSNLPVTLSEYTFYDKEDVETYLKLLELVPDYFQQCLDFEKEKSKRGYFMNFSCASEVIRQCSEYIATPEENLLIVTFNDKIGQVDGLTAEEIEEFKQRNHDNVINYVIPSYESAISTFKALSKTGKNNLGLAHYEEGKDYYKYLIASKVGTDKSPEEIITLLDQEITSTMSEYSTVAMSHYDEYNEYITAAQNNTIYNDIDLKDTIDYFQDAFTDRFPEIPDIEYSVTPVHESLENIVSPAFFMTPPLDDYTHNTIHTNIGEDSASSLWSTLAHEGIPGHMYQFVYFLSSDPSPIRVVMDFTGYQEGWATYVEQMSFEYYDGYAYECYRDFEEINNKLNLLVSARIEIGVNYEGWNMDETKNYLNSNGFNQDAAADIMTYVIAEPANYQMYCVGWLCFEELKEKAQKELGDNFNEKEFHKVILDAGPCQFFLLEEKVDQYIESNR